MSNFTKGTLEVQAKHLGYKDKTLFGPPKGYKQKLTPTRQRAKAETMLEMEKYIQGKYKELVEFMYNAAKKDWRAADALLMRGFGKPSEQVNLTGSIGIMAIIKTLNSSDEQSGDGEE